jgi:hypothetical protein
MDALPQTLAESLAALERRLGQQQPRILVVKQDVNEDLYCCPSGTGQADLILSTLLRTGPVAFFTELAAEFQIVETVDDAECQVWQERATELKWDTLAFFSSYRDRVPGRAYGQSRWAVSPESIDWNQFDIVVSMDVCVPERITRRFPKTLWCYYVREIKAPSYRASMSAPAPGQDIVLNHFFRLPSPDLPPHVLEFPYHLQRPECFHRLFGNPVPPIGQRNGVFVDHHTMVQLSAAQRNALTEFGVVASTIHVGSREVIPTSERIARRTMDDDLRERLLNSRYFLITPGQRRVFGTALVEAIAAGCLVIGNPESLGPHSFFFSPVTSAADVHEAIHKMKQLEADVNRAAAERLRQQQLLDYLCYVRPTLNLLDAWQKKSPSKASLTTD